MHGVLMWYSVCSVQAQPEPVKDEAMQKLIAQQLLLPCGIVRGAAVFSILGQNLC